MRFINYCFQKYKTLLLVLLCILVSSCHVGKQDPLQQLEELTEDIRLHHEEYTTADWKEAYAQYEQISKEMEEYQYSSEETKRIGKLEGECVGYFVKCAVNSLDGLKDEFSGFMDGFKETIE
jgi:hypothetical protein